MFTGIIQDTAIIVSLENEGSNLNICCKSNIASELKVDQSLSHNGVCLTVVKIVKDTYFVTVVKETLNITTFRYLNVGDEVNIERSLTLKDRLDGHIVYGHVDQIGECIDIHQNDGSWIFQFHYKSSNNIIVEKGSICVDGVSLTVIKPEENIFSVAIIPYTHHHTNFKNIKIGTKVNLEFDIFGKYISKIALTEL